MCGDAIMQLTALENRQLCSDTRTRTAMLRR